VRECEGAVRWEREVRGGVAFVLGMGAAAVIAISKARISPTSPAREYMTVQPLTYKGNDKRLVRLYTLQANPRQISPAERAAVKSQMADIPFVRMPPGGSHPKYALYVESYYIEYTGFIICSSAMKATIV
jgi:hypothetical protein